MTPPTSLDIRPAQTEEAAEYYRCHRAFVPLFGAGYLSDLVGGVMTPPYKSDGREERKGTWMKN